MPKAFNAYTTTECSCASASVSHQCKVELNSSSSLLSWLTSTTPLDTSPLHLCSAAMPTGAQLQTWGRRLTPSTVWRMGDQQTFGGHDHPGLEGQDSTASPLSSSGDCIRPALEHSLAGDGSHRDNFGENL